MEGNKRKKLLVTVDGSERSMNTVRQIGGSAVFRDMDLVLYTVFTGIPDAFWDLEKEPGSFKSFSSAYAWEDQHKKEIETFMKHSRETLIASGFAPERVKILIQKRKSGIARDIIHEAGAVNGYHALVLRRRGMGLIPEIIMGSVCTKILEKSNFIPLLIIGQIPLNDRFLIAVDGSEGAMRALDFAGAMLKGSPGQVQLTTVVRSAGLNAGNGNVLNELLKAVEPEMEKARQRLIGRGIEDGRISIKVLPGQQSRAGALAKEAADGDFGTIIMGRRGLSRVQEFFMGRVSNKVIQIARKHSVWIVP